MNQRLKTELHEDGHNNVTAVTTVQQLQETAAGNR